MSHVPRVGSKEVVKQTLELLVKSAAEWQASGLQRQGSNTGACLRSNFLLMAEIVVQQDAHLLIDDEMQLLANFKVQSSATPSSCRALVVIHYKLLTWFLQPNRYASTHNTAHNPW